MLAGDEVHVFSAFVIALGLVSLFSLWSLRGLRQGRGGWVRPVGYRRAVTVATDPTSAPSRSRAVARVPGLGAARAPVACARSRRDAPSSQRGGGFWAGEAALRPATTTASSLDGETPGPTRARAGSRRACAGPRASSTRRRLRDRGRGRARARRARPLRAPRRHVLAARGRSTASIPRLAALRELGVTAIELMPVATFPGERGWGYDGVYTSAPHPAYGGPDGLARLVDAAHREGLGVVLDVVYNHIGPGNEALRAFGPYFTDRFGETPWGEALDYAQAGRARVGDPERRALGARLPGRRPPPRRRARRPRRLARARARRAGRARARRQSGRARDQRDGPARLPAAARLGPRRDVARQPPPRAPRRADRRAGRLLRRVRRLDGADRRRAAAARRARGSSRPRRTTTRSATARSATGCPTRSGASPPPSSSSAPSRRSSSRARSTASGRRSGSSPTTSTRSSPTRRARAGGASSRTSPASGARCPTRRTPRPSSARS